MIDEIERPVFARSSLSLASSIKSLGKDLMSFGLRLGVVSCDGVSEFILFVYEGSDSVLQEDLSHRLRRNPTMLG
jgi:hypothetical protein